MFQTNKILYVRNCGIKYKTIHFIDPSPDWIVGVSGLELCLDNCSWIEHKELNLYPYDVGTDDGITYSVSVILFLNVTQAKCFSLTNVIIQDSNN